MIIYAILVMLMVLLCGIVFIENRFRAEANHRRVGDPLELV